MNLIALEASRDVECPRHSKDAENGGTKAVVALTGSPALKVQVMCEGIRYSEVLSRAALHSMPNYYPYRFKPGEHDPTGKGVTTVPYLINTADGTEIRILGNGDSPE